MDKRTINATRVDCFDPVVPTCNVASCADTYHVMEFDIGTDDYIYEDRESILFYLCGGHCDEFKESHRIAITGDVGYGKSREVEIILTEQQARDLF